MSSPRLAHVSIDAELADHLDGDADFLRRYIRAFAQAEVAAEIKGLRTRRQFKQADVARLVHTGQSAISRIEQANYDGWTFKTLLAIATALRARLRVSLEPIEDVSSKLRAADTDTGHVHVSASTLHSAGTLDSAALTDASPTIPERPLDDGGTTVSVWPLQ